MQSSIIAVQNENQNFQIKLLPELHEKPISMPPEQQLPFLMPQLIAAPGVTSKISNPRKRRNSENVDKRTSSPAAISFDDSSVYSYEKKQRRTKKEMRMAEFLEKQREGLEKIQKARAISPSLTTENPITKEAEKDLNDEMESRTKRRPRMKTVHQEFQQVVNIAFAVSRSKTIFKCISSWCNYITCDIDRFDDHLRTLHSDDSRLALHSFCMICNLKTEAKLISEEFEHMKQHVNSLLNLENLIQILDSSEVKLENEDEKKSGIKLDKLKFDFSSEIQSSTLLNTPPYADDDLNSSYDDIEQKLMKLFDDSPREKIRILSVESLPKIETIEIYDSDEESSDKMILPRVSVIVANNDGSPKKSTCSVETESSSDSELKTENFLLSEININKQLADEAAGNQAEGREQISETSQTEEISNLSQDEDLFHSLPESPELLRTKISEILVITPDEQAPLRKLILNMAERKTYPSPFLRAVSLDTPKIAIKKFKRSLSDLRRQDKLIEPTSVDIEQPGSHQTLSSDYIAKLIRDEKLAQPQNDGSPFEAESPDAYQSPVQQTLRRLSAINYQASTSKVSSPNECVNALTVSPKMESLSNQKKPVKLSFDNLRNYSASQLMSWVEKRFLRNNFKIEICYRKMLEKNSIVALFKCMSSRCSFATQDSELFLNHLNCHSNDVKICDNFFLYCAYCLFKSNELKPLVHHINDVHSRDIFQCSYCFYRSREKETCYQHIKKSHKNADVKIFRCPGLTMTEGAKKIFLNRLKTKRATYVAAIRCRSEFRSENKKNILNFSLSSFHFFFYFIFIYAAFLGQLKI